MHPGRSGARLGGYNLYCSFGSRFHEYLTEIQLLTVNPKLPLLILLTIANSLGPVASSVRPRERA